MKAMSATEILLIVGMTTVATTMFVQLPQEVNDMQQLLNHSSTNSIAESIAGLLNTISSSTSDVTFLYELPEKSTVSFKDNHVKVGDSSARTLVNIDASIGDVKTLEIKKISGKYEVRKYE